MTLSTNIKTQVNKIIDDWGNVITLMDVTPVVNAYGAITSYTVNNTGTVNCVPSNYFKMKYTRQPFGNLNEGETRMLFGSGTAFDTYRGTVGDWRAVMTINNFTGTYIPREEKPIILQGIEVAIPVVFKLDEESGY